MWYVYILECQNKDLYTGMTCDLERRLAEHKSGKGGHFTSSFKANKLLYSEIWTTKEKALRREAQIKGWTRRKKIALVSRDLQALKEA